MVLVDQSFGWSMWLGEGTRAWFKGYLVDGGVLRSGVAAASDLATRLRPEISDGQLNQTLRALDGSFAVIVENSHGVIGAVDRLRSIPLYYGEADGLAVLSDQALKVRDACHLADVDPQPSLEVAMAGYALDRGTLYKGLNQSRMGEWIRLRPGQSAETGRWYLYEPWDIDFSRNEAGWIAELSKTTHGLFEKMVMSLEGRPVMLPLSGGLDSRLVASALFRLGYKDVHCYAYGLPGNFEAETSRKVAERLGYRWTFIPYTPSSVRATLRSEEARAYLQFADSCSMPPFLQDFRAIFELKRQGLVPPGAIFMNGNSGDFITGNHIPKALTEIRLDLTQEQRRRRVYDEVIDKHFSLWQDLRSPENDERVRQRIAEGVARDKVPSLPPECDHALFEQIECQERQAKFVISGQRVYEFWNHDWRLPLWDLDYLNFWSRVPLGQKTGQKLYSTFLRETDWGGVWRAIPMKPKQTIRPRSVAALRLIAKAASAPFGRRFWHRIDRQVFHYWTNILSTYSEVPYWRLVMDRRGFRNAIAVRCRAYLERHGRDNDGQFAKSPSGAFR